LDEDHSTLQNAIAMSSAAVIEQADTLQPDGITSAELEDYEDYDLDAAAVVEGYAFEVIESASLDEEQSSECEKWDGKGTYQQKFVNQSDITPEEEDLLNQYQAMHDDGQVDTDLLLEVLRYINTSSHGDGAILVFLPGWQEISEFKMLLEYSAPFRDSFKYLILPLHSGIPSSDQRKVLQRPPTGIRKIILSTNIAETSLTIDDVAFVVDTGRAKEKDYDPHLKTSTLQATWISRASSKQRKGRAGRTKAGVCFHLFSSRRYKNMRPFVESELLRTPLVSCRKVKPSMLLLLLKIELFFRRKCA
jgi:HrpA-like RNA helicase